MKTLLINGEPIDFDKNYSVSYVTNQGVPGKSGENHKNIEVHAVEDMCNLLEEKGTYHAELYGTFEII